MGLKSGKKRVLASRILRDHCFCTATAFFSLLPVARIVLLSWNLFRQVGEKHFFVPPQIEHFKESGRSLNRTPLGIFAFLPHISGFYAYQQLLVWHCQISSGLDISSLSGIVLFSWLFFIEIGKELKIVPDFILGSSAFAPPKLIPARQWQE